MGLLVKPREDGDPHSAGGGPRAGAGADRSSQTRTAALAVPVDFCLRAAGTRLRGHSGR